MITAGGCIVQVISHYRPDLTVHAYERLPSRARREQVSRAEPVSAPSELQTEDRRRIFSRTEAAFPGAVSVECEVFHMDRWKVPSGRALECLRSACSASPFHRSTR